MKLRKLLAAVLVGVMTVSSLAISAFAADENTPNPQSLTKSDKSVSSIANLVSGLSEPNLSIASL